MPYVNVQITKGASADQKREVIKDITHSLQLHLGKKPHHTHIVIQEIEDDDWGFAGVPTSIWRKENS